jgi:hypothetical protein
MSYPLQAPWTGIGNLQSDISRIESELHRKANNYEVTSLHSDISTLANSIREVSAIVDELLCRLERCEDEIRRYQTESQ